VQNNLFCGSVLHLNSHLEIPCTAAKCSGWKWHAEMLREDLQGCQEGQCTKLSVQLSSQLSQLYLFASPCTMYSAHASGKQMVVSQRQSNFSLAG